MVTALPTAIAAALEVAINQVLQLDPDSLARLQALQGKVVAIELRGLNISFYLIPDDRGLNVFSHFEGEPDTVLRGTPLSMVRMGVAARPGDVLLAGDVEISGDVELGQQVREILDGLDIDWEEHLSHLTGDIVAHKLGDIARGVITWGRKTADILGQDVAEYLQEESRDLVTPSEVEEFLGQVDILRSDVDRFEARVSRLLQQRENLPQSETSNTNSDEVTRP